MINNTAFEKEVGKKGAYHANVIIWTTLFSMPLLWLLDYLFLKEDWADLLLIRLIGWGLSYVIYTLSIKRGWDYLTTLKWFVGVNILIHSIIAGIVPVNNMLAYFLVLSVVIFIINTTIVWPAIYSIYMCLFSFAILVILFSLKNRVDKFNIMAEHGGGVYFLISIFSCFMTHTRYTILNRELQKNAAIDIANSKLLVQNEKIRDQHYQIEESNRKLKVLNDYKQDTMNIMMHDFKNYTGSIQTSVEALKSRGDNLTYEQRDVLQSISSGNDKMNYLSQKLAQSAIEPDAAIVFNKETFDLNPEVERAVLEISDAAALRQVGLQLSLSPAVMMVYQDKLFTEQVIYKLLSNVIKQSPAGTIISVRADKHEDSCIVEAISHGHVIGMDKLNELFNKIRTTSFTDTEAISELGLASTKKTVEAMGGVMVYNSDEKTGNYFKIQFKSTH